MDKKSNRYLVITELYLPTKGGTAVWFDQVYRRLGGKEVHIVTADVPGAAEHDEMHPNSIHRVALKRYSWLKPESLLMYLKLLFKCIGLLLKHRFDSVHAGRVLPEGLVGLVVARLFRKPFYVYAHGEEITTWRDKGKKKAMTFVYHHADTIIVNSEFTRDVVTELGVDKNKMVLICPGVDTDVFKPGLEYEDLKRSIGLKPGDPLTLSVGRLSRRKGFDQVIRALGELSDLDMHYALIGIGQDERYLKKLATDVGVAERVHFLGHVSQEDLPRWYNACDFFIMANREIDGDTEGFGMVFIEAAACGKAVIAGEAGGTEAAVVHGETGLRIDGDLLAAITQAMRDLSVNISLRNNLGNNGYQRAVSMFSWDSVASNTLLLCDEE